MTPDDKPVLAKSASKKPRRKKWLIVPGIIAALVLLLIVLLPSLLCTGPGMRLILSQINSRIVGKVKISSLSIGWISPLSVSHLTLLDAEGIPVVRDADVKTHLSLLALLTDWHHLGQIDVPISSIHLAAVNGKLNLLQAVARQLLNPAAAASPAASTPAPASPKSPARANASTTGLAIPDLSGSLNLSIHRLTWVTPGEPPLNASDLQFTADFNTRSSKASHVTFAADVALGSTSPAKIRLRVQAVAFGKQGLLPLKEIRGSAAVHTRGLELASLNPLLASGGAKIKTRGLLALNAVATIKPHAVITSNIALQASHVYLRGAAIKGDTPNLGTVDFNLKTLVHSGGVIPSYQIEHCRFFSSHLGTASITGDGALKAILAIMPGHQTRATGTARLAIKLQSVISSVLKQFPHMLKAPQGAQFSGGNFTLSANITTVRSAAAGLRAAKDVIPSLVLPPVTFKFDTSLSPLTWTLPAHQHVRQAYGSVQLSGATTGGPVSIALQAFVGGGAAKASTVSLTGDVSPFADQHLRTLSFITGRMALKVSHFYLSYLQRLNLPVQVGGVLHGQLAMVSNQARQGRISGHLQIDTLSLGGKLLHGDHPVLGNLQIPIDMVWNAERLNIEQVALRCPAFDISAAGAVNLPRLSDLRSTGGNWGHTSITVQSTINTALFTDAFRHTLRMNHMPLRIKTGLATLRMELTSHGTLSAAKLHVAVSAQKCRWNDTLSVIDPLTVDASAARRAGRWSVKNINTFQTAPASAAPIWRVALHSMGKAKHLSYALASNWNLSALQQELGPFIEWDGRSVAGALSARGEFANVQTAAPHLAVTLALQHLVYHSDSKAPPIRIAAITIPVSARLAVNNGKLTSLTGDLSVQSPQLINVTASANITPAPMAVKHLTVNLISADLHRLWRMLQVLNPSLPEYQLAGHIINSPLEASYQPGRLQISQLSLHIRKISFSSGRRGAAPFTEPELDVALAANIRTGQAPRVAVSRLAVKSGNDVVTINMSKPTIGVLSKHGLQIAAPSVRVASDLGKLQNLLINLGKLPVGSKLTGQLVLDASALGHGQAFSLSLQTHVNGFDMLLPGRKTTLPPTNLLASLIGRADLKTKMFTATQTCQMGESAGKASAGNMLTIDRASVLAWGPNGIENLHGSLRYNLARLIALLKPFLPPTLSASGKGSIPLVVTGPLTPKPGLLVARQLTIAPTALKFTNLTYAGTVLGPGAIGFSESASRINIMPAAIPANHGTLHLGGYIDLAGDVPIYVLSSPLQLAQNVQINAPMGASVLKFLPLTWGNQGNPALLNVQGLLNMSLQNASLPLSSAAMNKTGTAAGTVSVTYLTTNAPFVAQVSALAGPLGGNVSIADSGIRPTAFVLKNGLVSYKNMMLVLASYGLDLSGWVSLDNQMDVDLSITGGGLTLPIPLKLVGSTGSPHIKLTSQPLKSIGKGIKGQVKNLLHGFFGQ